MNKMILHTGVLARLILIYLFCGLPMVIGTSALADTQINIPSCSELAKFYDDGMNSLIVNGRIDARLSALGIGKSLVDWQDSDFDLLQDAYGRCKQEDPNFLIRIYAPYLHQLVGESLAYLKKERQARVQETALNDEISELSKEVAILKGKADRLLWAGAESQHSSPGPRQSEF